MARPAPLFLRKIAAEQGVRGWRMQGMSAKEQRGEKMKKENVKKGTELDIGEFNKQLEFLEKEHHNPKVREELENSFFHAMRCLWYLHNLDVWIDGKPRIEYELGFSFVCGEKQIVVKISDLKP